MDGYIDKLEQAQNLSVDKDAYIGKYELNRESIQDFLERLRRKDVLNNADVTGQILLGSRGIRKLTNFGMSNDIYKKLFAHIPEMLKMAIAFPDYKSNKKGSHYPVFKDLIVGVEIEEKPVTVRILLGKRGAYWYYTHFITELDKKSLIAAVHKPNAGGNQAIIDKVKDKRLLEIIQEWTADVSVYPAIS